MSCDHSSVSVTPESPVTRSDGSIAKFERKECNSCGEKWRELKVISNNISTNEYIRHLSRGHSENSPKIRKVKEEEYARSGERLPDVYVDYDDCPICIKWAKQQHQWVS